MEWKSPKQLKAGMTLGFVAPASASSESLGTIELLCQAHGYGVVFGDSCYQSGLYGGSPQEQAAELNNFLTNDSIDAVIALRGGYGTMRYLDLLDYEGIRQAAKAFVGYSDCTALHMAIQSKSRLITYHGPMGVDWCKSYDADLAGSQKLQASYQEDLQSLFATLEGRLQVIEPLPEPPRGYIGTELGEGTLRGGNMTLLAMLAGTPYGLDALGEKDLADTILFLEEVGEAPYKLDRMLQQLRLQGVLRLIKGIAFGSFQACDGDEDEADYDIGYHALRYMEEGRDCEKREPFVCYLPAGHGTPHHSLPLGGRVSFRYISNALVVYPYFQRSE